MLDELRLFAKLFLISTVLVMIFFYLLAIILGPALFFFTAEGIITSTHYLSVLTIWILIIPLSIPIGLTVGVLFFGIWSIFALSFIISWKLRENFHKTIKESLFRPAEKLFNSCLFTIPILNSMTLLTVIIINSFQEAGGIPTGAPPLVGEPFLDFFNMSYSAVVEELGFRLIPIGAFLIIYLYITGNNMMEFSLRKKMKFLCIAILFPDRAKRMVGAKTVNEHGIGGGISLGEWGMVVFTSIVFGLAHFDPGVSWEIGKVSSAAVAGLVLGLNYLLYGIQAPLVMHWFFNAYADTYLLLSEIYPVAESFANGVIIFNFILGFLGWAAVAILCLRKLAKGI